VSFSRPWHNIYQRGLQCSPNSLNYRLRENWYSNPLHSWMHAAWKSCAFSWKGKKCCFWLSIYLHYMVFLSCFLWKFSRSLRLLSCVLSPMTKDSFLFGFVNLASKLPKFTASNRIKLRIKCPKIVCGWGCAPNPAGKLTTLPHTPKSTE